MIKQYYLEKGKKDKYTMTVHEEGLITEKISCSDQDPIEQGILVKNKVEYASDKEQYLKERLKNIIKTRKLAKYSTIVSGISFVACCALLPILATNFLNAVIISSIGLITFAYTAINMIESNLLTKQIGNLQYMIKTIRKDIKNANASEEDKKKYLHFEKSASITTVNIEKMMEDYDNRCNENWYYLNSIGCMRAIKKSKNSHQAMARLSKVFEPVNTNEETTKKYVKAKYNDLMSTWKK